MSKTFKEMALEVERQSAQKMDEQEKWVEERTEEWNLGDRDVHIPIVRTNTLSLEKEMCALAETKEAASMVGLPILEQTSLMVLSLANTLYKKTSGEYLELPAVKPEDYLVSAKDLCRQIKETKLKWEDLKVEEGGVEGKGNEEDEVELVEDGRAAGVSVEGDGFDGSDGGVEVTVEESGGVRVEVGAAGGSVEGGGVEESAVGGRGGDESDHEGVDFVGVNFDDQAGARVEDSGGENDDECVVGVGMDVGGGAGEVGFVVGKARGGDDGAVVAGEVGDGKSGNGGVEGAGEVGFVVEKARGGDDNAVVAGEVGDDNGRGVKGGVEGGVEGDGVKDDPKNPKRQCHFCDHFGQNLKRHIQKHHRGQLRGEGAVERAIFIEAETKKIRKETLCCRQQVRAH